MKVPGGTAAEIIGPALSYMVRVCFKPFSLGKWFVMGFCAFLASCGEGGGGNFNIPNTSSGRGGRHGGGAPMPDVGHWISANLALFVVLVILAVVIMLALWVLAMFLRSRGTFMLLDNVVKDRAAVVETWSAYRNEARSYFLFLLAMMAAGIAVFILAGGIGLLLAIPDISAGHFDGMALAGLLVGILILVCCSIPLAIISALVDNFVVPIMFLRRTGIKAAWAEARTHVFAGNFWPIVLYFLLKAMLNVGGAIAVMIATCLTCCIGALPYLSSVLALPVHVFNRSYSLIFLERCNSAYHLLEKADAPAGFPVIPTSDAPYWGNQPPPPPPSPQ